jgi:hypothetical protein
MTSICKRRTPQWWRRPLEKSNRSPRGRYGSSGCSSARGRCGIDGDRTWSETLRRVHVSIAHGTLRAMFDIAEFRFDVMRRCASALTGAGKERKPPKKIRLAEHIGAAILPFAPVAKLQSAALHDGKGDPVAEHLAITSRRTGSGRAIASGRDVHGFTSGWRRSA